MMYSSIHKYFTIRKNQKSVLRRAFFSNKKGETMNIISIIKNPIVLAISEKLLEPVISLVSSLVIPKIKREAFEKMTEYLQIFADFILEQKSNVEATATTLDDEAYNLSKEAFKAFLDEANALYAKM